MKTMIVTLTAASLLVLGACSSQRPLGRDFGNATQQNLAVQVVNPEASQKPPTHDGAHTAAAVIRYRQGEVVEPTPEETAGGN